MSKRKTFEQDENVEVQREVGYTVKWESATYEKSHGAGWRGWHRVRLPKDHGRYIDSASGMGCAPDNPRAYLTYNLNVPSQRIRKVKVRAAESAGPMKESTTQRALTVLDGTKYAGDGLSAGCVGDYVWPNREVRPGKGVATGGGGDYAAQMLLGRLKKRGLVRTLITEGSSRWAITAAGTAELRRLEST